MNIFLTVQRRLQLAAKRREIARIAEFERQLEDQILSGQASLKWHSDKRRKLEAECGLLETPDDIVRREGCGA